VIFSVYSQNPLPAALLCHLAGIGKRLAHCRENPYGLLTDWVAETEPQHGTRHEVERQLALVTQVGASTPDRGMRFNVSPADAASLTHRLSQLGARLNAPYLVIHPGASAASRRYPAERLAEVAGRLAQIADCAIFVTGGRDEAALTAQVSDAHANAIDLAGLLSLGELAALIRGASVLISNNSGPSISLRHSARPSSISMRSRIRSTCRGRRPTACYITTCLAAGVIAACVPKDITRV